jgi:hypothetical protein
MAQKDTLNLYLEMDIFRNLAKASNSTATSSLYWWMQMHRFMLDETGFCVSKPKNLLYPQASRRTKQRPLPETQSPRSKHLRATVNANVQSATRSTLWFLKPLMYRETQSIQRQFECDHHQAFEKRKTKAQPRQLVTASWQDGWMGRV